MEVMEKIQTYLKALGLSHEVQVQKGKVVRVMVPYTISDKDLNFNVIIDSTARFVRFWVLLMQHTVIKGKKKQEALYHALLEANGQLSEIKYFVTEQGDVGIVGHEELAVLTIDGFKAEFEAIPAGILYFLNVIASKLGLPLKLPDPSDLSIYT
jgi:hypothetical protein